MNDCFVKYVEKDEEIMLGHLQQASYFNQNG
jgi:hypothetical protein